jgi:hypothetical protein
MSTVRELLTDAFLEAGILADGESMSASQGAFALRKLNRLLDTWSAEGLVIYETISEQITMESLTGGIQINQALGLSLPLYISKANILIDYIRHTLELIGPDKYSNYKDTAGTGQPRYLYHQGRGMDASYLYWWPNTDQEYTLELFFKTRLDSYTSLDTSVSVLPPGYERLIVSNLAVDLCPAYGVSASAEMVKAAQDSYTACHRLSHVAPVSTSDLESSSVYNIETDSYEV